LDFSGSGIRSNSSATNKPKLISSVKLFKFQAVLLLSGHGKLAKRFWRVLVKDVMDDSKCMALLFFILPEFFVLLGIVCNVGDGEFEVDAHTAI